MRVQQDTTREAGGTSPSVLTLMLNVFLISSGVLPARRGSVMGSASARQGLAPERCYASVLCDPDLPLIMLATVWHVRSSRPLMLR